MYLQLQVFTFILILLTNIRSTTGESWNYNNLGPDVWGDIDSLCNGRSQSPINIQTACTNYQSFAPFSFQSDYNLTHNFTLLNNGHSIVGTYIGNNPMSLRLNGGGLNGTYEFLQFHLHWGENYKSGSEHQVNGMKYAGEIHFVHRNIETLKLAVLGFFMESISNTSTSNIIHKTTATDIYKTNNSTSEEWQKYFAVSEYLRVMNNATTVNLNLASLMGSNLNNFWRYDGSLTTPPCTEDVKWTMFKTPIVFSDININIFRHTISFENYRGPQPLYNRTVYRNFLHETILPITDYFCCIGNMNNLANKHFLHAANKLILYTFILFTVF
ncbi:unnamed protein product [Adineta steineri]|uniref:Carbonic anhydrase n=1 Tax=Adineta steineri TaxID=433720 RepID=A0A815DH43_9BILA|nr:unnamed protein product [Adineta steineri]CAF1298237.1 unnamed protein product [Adineta steineri]